MIENSQVLRAASCRFTTRVSDRLTPLEAMLASAENADLPEVCAVLSKLMRAGAKITPRAKREAARIYKSMDFFKDAMQPAFRKKCLAAATEICTLTGSVPKAPRVVNDGQSAITVLAGSHKKQFDALWKALVPGSGNAKTLQGEVVRVAGRLNYELFENGGCNWDRDHRRMARAFARYVRSDNSLDAKALRLIDALVAKLDRKTVDIDDCLPLCVAAVAWVKRNPTPTKCPSVDYDR